MQNDTSKFLVNIVPLQNLNATVSGTNATNILSNNVAAIQQMVNTTNKSIRINTIQSFTSNTSINFISPINLSNVGIMSNGTPYVTEKTLISTLSVSSLTGSSGAFSGIVYAQQFVTLSDILAKTGMREWSSPVLSDLSKIHPYIFNYSTSSQTSEKQEIGLMAQEVEAIWPELIKDGVKKYINYDGVVALLVKAVQELGGRVSTLEGGVE